MNESIVVKCPCGRTYDAGMTIECPVCGESSKNATLMSAMGGAGTPSPSSQERRTAPATPGVRAPFGGPVNERRAVAQKAEAQAKSLSVIAGIISVLGIIGGVIVAFAGFIFLTDEATRPVGLLVMASGIAGILVWIFIGTFAQTIAEGVRALAALLRD